MIRHGRHQPFFVALIILALLMACQLGDISQLVSEVTKPTPVPTLETIETPVLEPRPDFIQAVGPEEYSIVPKALYDLVLEGSVGYSITKSLLGFKSSICVRPLLRPLIEQGDYFEDSDIGEQMIWDRMALLVDDEPMEAHGIVYNGGLPARPPSDSPMRGDTAWIEGGDYCWKAPLEVGRHQVTFQFRQTSGKVAEYSWVFEISE
jgi:hypothetical protein